MAYASYLRLGCRLNESAHLKDYHPCINAFIAQINCNKFYYKNKVLLFFCSLEDFDVEEEDEEALIEQRRLQRLAIVEVSKEVKTSTNTSLPQCLASICLIHIK